MILLPKEYIAAELLYIEHELESLPDLTYGRRTKNGIETDVIYYRFEGKRKEKVLSQVSPDTLSVANRRIELNKRKAILSKAWKDNFRGSVNEFSEQLVFKRILTKYDNAFFDAAEDQQGNPTDPRPYSHGIYDMRSRGEVTIAKDFEALGLPYKYDVRVPGTNYIADFLVDYPALDCCSFFEFLGKADDLSYATGNANKIAIMFGHGLRLNYELSLLTGTSDSMSTQYEVENSVNHVIMNLVRERVGMKSLR